MKLGYFDIQFTNQSGKPLDDNFSFLSFSFFTNSLSVTCCVCSFSVSLGVSVDSLPLSNDFGVELTPALLLSLTACSSCSINRTRWTGC